MNIRQIFAAGKRLARLRAFGPRSGQPALHSAGRVRQVRARARATRRWEELGWVCRTGLLPGGVPAAQYSGFYQTACGRKFQGLVIETAQNVEPYIVGPPLDDIRLHTGHDPCFRPRPDGLHFVHLGSLPRTADEAIVNVEALLNECAQRAGWRSVAIPKVTRAIARKAQGGV